MAMAAEDKRQLEQAIDEQIARDYIRSNIATVYVNVIDASNLERNLYLTAQLIEMQLGLVGIMQDEKLALAAT